VDDAEKVIGIASTERDITERKQAEEALRTSESMLNEMGRIAEVGGWEMDLITRRARWTKGTYDIVEIGYGDPIPGPDEHVSFYLPEYRPVVEGAMKRLIEDDIALKFEAKLRTTKGNIKWCRALGKAVRKDGVCIRVYGTFQNITERKRAEEKIQQLNVELEQRVRDRTAELEAANKELETFSYSVSHDLRAPLRGIDGFSRILLEKYSAQLDDEGKDSLQRVRAATQRMGELIDDLLTLSRATRAELRRTAVDLTALAGEIVAELERAEPTRRVRWVIAPGLAATGDRQLLRVVLDNLLNNAWKFTSRQAEARIEFGAMKGEQGCAFFVRDNGVGFDMAYAGKLFGAFQRLHATADFPGTGIGLATVQRIIHRHGGRVWAEGQVNHGATFYFTLPATTQQP
jgi:signal transduction histidine kinase